MAKKRKKKIIIEVGEFVPFPPELGGPYFGMRCATFTSGTPEEKRAAHVRTIKYFREAAANYDAADVAVIKPPTTD